MLANRLAPAQEPAVADLIGACEIEVDLEAEKARPWSRMWVAVPGEGEAPVAFLLSWAVADELHILQVATHPDMRRRGAGGAVLDAALRYAASEHVRLILLEVRRSNEAAIALYRSRGFHVIGVRRGYYGRDGEDALEMMLTLDPLTGAVQAGHDDVSIL